MRSTTPSWPHPWLHAPLLLALGLVGCAEQSTVDGVAPQSDPPPATMHTALLPPSRATALGSRTEKPRRRRTPRWRWHRDRDAPRLRQMRRLRITQSRFARGGSSLTLRLDFADGSAAAFKPLQIHPHTNPRKELAAYHLDRLLGLRRVPPATWRDIPVATIRRTLLPTDRSALPRLAAEGFVYRGRLHGTLSHWVPQIRALPLHRPAARARWEGWLAGKTPIPPKDRRRAAQLSLLVVFDLLIDNLDRWTGGNVLSDPSGRYLYFMDNADSFFAAPAGHTYQRAALLQTRVFSRRLYRRLRRLTRARLAAALRANASGPRPILTTAEEDAVWARRTFIVTHIARVIAEDGKRRALAFP